jgi:hypothetical protein
VKATRIHGILDCRELPRACGSSAIPSNARDGQAAPGDIHWGKWEITLETTMEGLPVAMPPTRTTDTQCLTPKDAVLEGSKDQKCTVTEQKVEGGKVSWAVTCPGKSRVEGTGTIAYAIPSRASST